MSLRHLLAGSVVLIVIIPLGAVAQTPPAARLRTSCQMVT